MDPRVQDYSEQNIDIGDPGCLMEMPGDPANQRFTVTYQPGPGEYDPSAVDIGGEGEQLNSKSLAFSAIY